MQVDDAEGGVEALSPLMQDLHIGTIRKRRRSRDAEMLQTTRRRSKAARLPAGCEESQAERREEQPGRGSGGQIRSESTAIVPWKPPIVPGFPPEACTSAVQMSTMMATGHRYRWRRKAADGVLDGAQFQNVSHHCIIP
eukprot:Polyplicarium_translucidae@DN1408_c0_g2_i1.p1